MSDEPNWLLLQSLWEDVVGSESTLGARCGRWRVRKEFSGEGLAPIAGDPDEVAVYYGQRHHRREIARYPLAEVAQT